MQLLTKKPAAANPASRTLLQPALHDPNLRIEAKSTIDDAGLHNPRSGAG